MARKSRKNLLQPEQATVSVQFPELDEEKIIADAEQHMREINRKSGI